MKKNYRETALFKAIAGLSAAGLIGLSASTTAFAFDDGYNGFGPSGEIYGINFTGDLDFNNFSVMGFSQKFVPGLQGTSKATMDSFFSFDNGLATAQLPLFTMGNNIKYPGILYNRSGTQFFEHVANAVDGNEASQTMIWPYVVGGVVLTGGIVALIVSNSDSSSDSNDVNNHLVDQNTNQDTTTTSTPDPNSDPDNTHVDTSPL